MLDTSTKKKDNRQCKIAIRNAGMKQDDLARVLIVSQSVVSRPLKEHRESGSIRNKETNFCKVVAAYKQVRDYMAFLYQIAGILILLSTTINFWYLSKDTFLTVMVLSN